MADFIKLPTNSLSESVGAHVEYAIFKSKAIEACTASDKQDSGIEKNVRIEVREFPEKGPPLDIEITATHGDLPTAFSFHSALENEPRF